MRLNLKAFLITGFLFLLPFATFSQKHTLSGYVKDAASGEDMASVKIIVPSLGTGTLTNEYGFYSITLPEGEYDVIYTYLGYQNDTIKVSLKEDVRQNVEIKEVEVEVGTVEITDEVESGNVTSNEMSVQTLSLRQVKTLPAFMGEVDVIRTVQLLPGVSGVGEGITGYYVRGGQANQNLIQLDEATVYNASHLMGFFSVFNADALKDEYKLFKGGIPAEYGKRLSSVLDLQMKEGNSHGYHAAGGLGLISSRLTLEGPIVNDKSSFMVSGRRTYADMFLKFAKNPDLKQTRLYFYDFNAKANYRISDKDRIFLSGYFGRDVLKFRDLFSNDWGNATGTVRWNHLFSDKLFCNTTLIFSDFQYGFGATMFNGDKFEFKSGIRDYGFKTDFSWYANPKNQLKFGVESILHKFNPGVFIPSDTTYLEVLDVDPDYAVESAAYISNEQTFSNRFSMVYGLRFSIFDHIGPGDEYNYSEGYGEVLDTTAFNPGQIIQQYQGFEPRVSARYILTSNSSIKASYMRTRQYIHLASNSTASFPWDIWVPSSRHIQPQIADQLAVGYFRNLMDNKIETSVELYYKDMKNQIDFKNGAELILNPTIETEILIGKGWSYGSEFFVKKKTGRLTGWVGYTLSKTMRQVDGINDDKPYFATNDRRHDVSVVATYKFRERWTFGGVWVYATGNAVTFPVGGYYLDGNFVALYGDRNSNRMPAYHRMDLSVTLDGKTKEDKNKKRKLESSWNLSVFNAYGRRNAFAIDFREGTETRPVAGQPGVTEEVTVHKAVKMYLFRWVPSVTWNFNF